MYNGIFASKTDARLYDLLVLFQQGDGGSYKSIIERFDWLIKKASYNSYIGAVDDDLQADICLTLFTRLQRFVILDSEALKQQAARQDAMIAAPSPLM